MLINFLSNQVEAEEDEVIIKEDNKEVELAVVLPRIN